MKAAHRRGTYQTRAKRVTLAAAANPNTRCWRCGHTLDQHPPHHNGRPAWWTAGHVIDGQINGELRPEASTCNFAAGAELRNNRNYTLTPTRRR